MFLEISPFLSQRMRNHYVFTFADDLKFCFVIFFTYTRADQNTGGALLDFPMRTAMQRKSRVLSAISVCDN